MTSVLVRPHLQLTSAHVASQQLVALVTGAAVTAHRVVALVLAPSVPLAALVHICARRRDGRGKCRATLAAGSCDWRKR